MNQHGGLKRLKEYVVSVQFQIASFNTWQYIHLQIMGSRLESSHGMDCSGIRAWAGTGHWKQVLKDEERGMSWSWSKMCKCAMCFGTSAHGQQGCVPSTN
jgi:hypothetical protein